MQLNTCARNEDAWEIALAESDEEEIDDEHNDNMWAVALASSDADDDSAHETEGTADRTAPTRPPFIEEVRMGALRTTKHVRSMNDNYCVEPMYYVQLQYMFVCIFSFTLCVLVLPQPYCQRCAHKHGELRLDMYVCVCQSCRRLIERMQGPPMLSVGKGV